MARDAPQVHQNNVSRHSPVFMINKTQKAFLDH